MSDTEHYFAPRDDLPSKRRTIAVRLAGSEWELQTDHGVFSMNRLDLGTSVLLRSVPAPTESTAHVLDLGCGWGPIAISAALQAPHATVWGVDVNQRALTLAQDNAARVGVSNIRLSAPENVPPDIHFDAIWSNPPIRIGKEALHDMLRTWLPRLSAQGEAFLVVAKNLGADSLVPVMNREFPELVTAKYASAKGFRILRTAWRT